MSTFKSRGHVQHVDSTVTCPDCGRRFRTGTVIAEHGDGSFTASFTSKQNGLWGALRIPAEMVKWNEDYAGAWKVKYPDDPAPFTAGAVLHNHGKPPN
jgi:hypothetical protein